jgi:hypothetical protein
MNAQGTPDWLVEGAKVAVTYRGAYTGKPGNIELHTVRRVGKATCTLSTGDKYSIRTLERDPKENVVSFAKLADPEDRMIKATLQRQERDRARGRIREAYEAFQRQASPEHTQALMDRLAAYQVLATVGG